jgi:MFS family permease
MFLGTLLTAAVPIGYLFSTVPWHIYVWQIVYALGMAMSLPSWLAIFTRHVDKGQEAFEWGLESTSIGLGAGIAGGLGGIVSTYLGFPILFISVAVLNLISAICLITARDKVFSRRDGVSAIMDKPTIVP